MEIDDRLAKLEQLSLQVEACAGAYQRRIALDQTELIATSCLEIATEHVRSMIILTRRWHYATAFALHRVMFESLVRHFWFQHVAEQQHIEKLKKDKLELSIRIMQSELKESKPKIAKLIDTVWQHSSSLHSFTHTGRDQIFRRIANAKGSVGGTYDEDSSTALEQICESYLLQICLAYSEMFNDQLFNMSISTIIKQFENTPSAPFWPML
jgi:hypothetical protein